MNGDEEFNYIFDESLLDDCPQIVKNMVEAEKMIYNISDYNINEVAEKLTDFFPESQIKYAYMVIILCQSQYEILTRDLGKLWLLLPYYQINSNISEYFKGYLYKLGAKGISKPNKKYLEKKYDFNGWAENDDLEALKTLDEWRISRKIHKAIKYNAKKCIEYITKETSYYSFSNSYREVAIQSRDENLMKEYESFSTRENSLEYAIQYHCNDKVLQIIKKFGISPIDIDFCYKYHNTLALVFLWKLNVTNGLQSTLSQAFKDKSVLFSEYLNDIYTKSAFDNKKSLEKLAVDSGNFNLFFKLFETKDTLPFDSLIGFIDNEEALRFILSKRALPDNESSPTTVLNENGWDVNSALLFASQKSNLDIVKLLIENGADINYGNDSTTVFYNSLRSENENIPLFLMEQGVSIKKINNMPPPLFVAFDNYSINVIEALISKGCDINQKYEEKTLLCKSISKCLRYRLDKEKSKLMFMKLLEHNPDLSNLTKITKELDNYNCDNDLLWEIAKRITSKNVVGIKNFFTLCANKKCAKACNYLYDNDFVSLTINDAKNMNDPEIIEKILIHEQDKLTKEEKPTNGNIKAVNYNSVNNICLDLTMQYSILPLFKKLSELDEDILGEKSRSKPSLFYAINNKKLSIVEYLISKGADVNITINNESPVSLAFKSNEPDILNAILEAGAKIQNIHFDRYGYRFGNTEDIEKKKKVLNLINEEYLYDEELRNLLNSMKYERNNSDEEEKTRREKYICFLIEKGTGDVKFEQISILLTNKMVKEVKMLLNKNDALFSEPIILELIQNNNLQLCKEFIQFGCDINVGSNNYSRSYTPLSCAIKEENDAFISLLLDNNVNLVDYSAAKEAIRHNNLKLFKLALDAGVSDDLEFISLALYQNDISFLKLALECNKNLNSVSNNIIEDILRSNNKEKFDLCCEAGIIIPDMLRYNSSVVFAAQGGYDVSLECLLNQGKSFETDKNGYNPLTESVLHSSNSKCIKHLIERGATLGSNIEKISQVFIDNVKKNNTDFIRCLIKGNCYWDYRTEDGTTALCYAAQEGNIEMAKLLIENGANIEAKNDSNETPLVFAIKNNKYDMMKYLIQEEGCNIHAKNDIAFNVAFSNQNIQAIQILIENGFVFPQERLSVIEAVKTDNADFVDFIISLGGNVNEEIRFQKLRISPIGTAIERDNFDIIKILIARGANLKPVEVLEKAVNERFLEKMRTIYNISLIYDINSETNAVVKAVKEGYVEIINELIRYGADLSVFERNNCNLLQTAINKKDKTLVNLLIGALDLHSLADDYTEDIIVSAVHCDDIDLVKYLLESGIQLDDQNLLALNAAIQKGNSEIVKIILENEKVDIKEDVLLKAIEKHNNDIFEMIISKFRSISLRVSSHLISNNMLNIIQKHRIKLDITQTFNDISLLEYAIQSKSLEMIDYILSFGNKALNTANETKGCIFYAIESGNSEIIKKIVEHNAKLNILDDQGKTPLYYAISNGDLDLIKYLIEHKADISLRFKSEKSDTYMHAAKKYEVISYLMDINVQHNNNNKDGETPFSLFLKRYSDGEYKKEEADKILTLFLDKGVDVNDVNGQGTPCFFCLNNDDLFKTLLQKGLDINKQDKDGNPYMYYRILNHQNKIANIKKFITIGDPNIVNNEGYNLYFILVSLKLDELCIDEIKAIGASSECDKIKIVSAALKKDDSEIIKYFFERKFDFTPIIHDTPLVFYALKNNLPKITDLLILEKKQYEAKDPASGKSVLIYIIKESKHNHKFGTYYLNRSCIKHYLNEPDKRGVTPLMFAVNNNDKDWCELLIRYGADVNAEDKQGNTALQRAITRNYKDIADYLVKKGADINHASKSGKTYLIKAVDTQPKKEVNKVLYKNVDINLVVNGEATIFHVLEKGNDGVAKLMINQGCDLDCFNEKKETPLAVACRNNCTLVFNYILSQDDVNVNTVDVDGNTPLINASRSKATYFVKKLLEKSADISNINKDGEDALIVAATQGSANIVSLLLNKGASVSTINKKGRNALFKAVSKKYKTIINELLNAGSDTNIVDRKGETILILASKRGFNDIVYKIIGKVNDVDYAEKKTGNTALSYAACHGKFICLKHLIKHGADVNHANVDQKTPLMLAAENARAKSIELLLDCENIDLLAKDKNGKTACDLAKNANIRNMILEKMDKLGKLQHTEAEEKVTEHKEEKKKAKKFIFINVEKTKTVKGKKVVYTKRKKVFIDEAEAKKREADKERVKKEMYEKKLKSKEETIRRSLTKRFAKQKGAITPEEMEAKIQKKIDIMREEEKKKQLYGCSLLKAAIQKRRGIRNTDDDE